MVLPARFINSQLLARYECHCSGAAFRLTSVVPHHSPTVVLNISIPQEQRMVQHALLGVLKAPRPVRLAHPATDAALIPILATLYIATQSWKGSLRASVEHLAVSHSLVSIGTR